MPLNIEKDRPIFAFTVFTATYNRAHTLHRVYKSLQDQTFHDFEWIVGDDGSTDNTESIVKEWQLEANFRISYFRQKHAGKNFAFNQGVRYSKGEYFVEVDSDDEIKPEALERAYYHWQKIPFEVRSNYFVVMFSCEDENGNRVGPVFPKVTRDFDYRKFNYSLQYISEKWRCFRTSVLREYPFNETVKGCHIFESTLFCEIAKSYKARFTDEIMRVYYLDGPSITRQSKHPMQNMEGLRLSILYTLNNDLDFLLKRPLHFLRKAMNYSRFSFHSNIQVIAQFSALETLSAKLIFCIMFPFALIKYLIDLLRNNTPHAAKKPVNTN